MNHAWVNALKCTNDQKISKDIKKTSLKLSALPNDIIEGAPAVSERLPLWPARPNFATLFWTSRSVQERYGSYSLWQV